jgi:three-Cys-motif partner protein
MVKKVYEWDFYNPSKIEQHSLAKHKIIADYLARYIKTLAPSPYQDELKLTLIDGFSGGGIYSHTDTKEIFYGSPLIMLNTVKEVNFLINQNRTKKLNLNVDYFFIDKEKSACDCLKLVLDDKDYSSLVGKSIFVIHSDFKQEANSIINFIRQKSPKRQRAIFLLDQYGYSEVPTQLIKFILDSLSNAEIIFTFAVDSFITYLSDKNGTSEKLFIKTGLPDVLQGRTIEDIKNSEKDSRLLIQSYFHKELVEKCGASYYTPFFIRSSQGHGDYWLVHLSKHPKARDVMTQIHWQNNNNFIHYGGAGLNMFMLGYESKYDSSYTNQTEFGFCFDDTAHEKSINALITDIPHLVYARDNGISFGDLFSMTCNNSPASAEIYKKAIEHLIQYKEIDVFSKEGSRRLSANTICDSDILSKPTQSSILFTFI